MTRVVHKREEHPSQKRLEFLYVKDDQQSLAEARSRNNQERKEKYDHSYLSALPIEATEFLLAE